MKLGIKPFSAKCLPAILCLLWFSAADPAPASAFDARATVRNDTARPMIRLAQNDIWVQFFDRNKRRDGRNQRRQRRQFDVTPLRTDPRDRQLRMREFRSRDGNQGRRQRQEQDAAREAVRRGEIQSLGGIIRSVQSHCPGKFLGAKLQRGRGGFSYRVRILRPSGRRIGLTVDARSGAVIGGRCR